LRERGGDIGLLARAFLARDGREFGRRLQGFDATALAAMAAHRWPGNVRELMNRVRRAALMAEGPLVTAEDLELAAPTPAAVEAQAADSEVDLDLRAARMRAERDAIERALARSQGSLAAAARLLGISRPTLYSLLETHGIPLPRPEAGTAAASADAV
jgi:two-component system NtrC family response regulator